MPLWSPLPLLYPPLSGKRSLSLSFYVERAARRAANVENIISLFGRYIMIHFYYWGALYYLFGGTVVILEMMLAFI